MPTLTALSSTLQTLFGPTAHKEARLSGVVQRVSKLSGSLLLIILVCGFLEQPTASYGYLAQVAYDLGLEISRQALQERLVQKTALKFMQKMFEHSLEKLQTKIGLELTELSEFKAIYLHDSTQIVLPNQLATLYPSTAQGKAKGSRAGLKLQVTWDWLHQHLAKVSVHAAKASDLGYHLALENLARGSLIMFDLGYFVLETFKGLAKGGVWWVSRLDLKCCVYQPGVASPFDLLAYAQKRQSNWVELALEVGQTERVSGRVVVVRLPPQVVEERLRKAHAQAKRCGYSLSETKQAWQSYNVYWTNLPCEKFSCQQIVLLYRMRWQVELVFKLAKSQAGLDQILGQREERILGEIYAKLIGLVVFYYLTSPARVEVAETGQSNQELSYSRAMQSYRRQALRLGMGLSGQTDLSTVLADLSARWERFGQRDRRQRLSSYQQLAQGVLDLAPRRVSQVKVV